MTMTHGGASNGHRLLRDRALPCSRGKPTQDFATQLMGSSEKRVFEGGLVLGLRGGSVFVIWKVLALFETHCKPTFIGVRPVVLRWQISLPSGANAVTKIVSWALESRQPHLATSPLQPLTMTFAAIATQTIESRQWASRCKRRVKARHWLPRQYHVFFFGLTASDL